MAPASGAALVTAAFDDVVEPLKPRSPLFALLLPPLVEATAPVEDEEVSPGDDGPAPL
jgi:hypothetical protein